MTAHDAELAVVVLSHGPRQTLRAAVQSLLDQDCPAEIIVVHSGSGDVVGLLPGGERRVAVVESKERLLPGGARNLGVVHTKAPYIAFLADDCVAEQGWVRERLKAHRSSGGAVASALVCHDPRNPIALAAHLSVFARRLPRAAPAVALRYGASYPREFFARYGDFRDDLESGEDTEFHQRLSEAERPLWTPGVRTMHHGPTTLPQFLSAQRRRGYRMAIAWRALGTHDAQSVARNALERTGQIIAQSWRAAEPGTRVATLLAAPLIAIGGVAYALGAWSARQRR